MKVVAIIPARFDSSRFPGKPLADLLGQSMIQRVFAKVRAAKTVDEVYVATDSDRIVEHCRYFDIPTLLTSSECLTGTDRVYEASAGIEADLIVNVQGDEPLIDPGDVDELVAVAKDGSWPVVNGMQEILREDDFYSPNIPKVVCDQNGSLLYMSRAAIPTDKKLGFSYAKKQVCIYVFTKEALNVYGSCKSKTPLESIEDIEILRFLECGIGVQMHPVAGESVAIDTPQDRDRVLDILRGRESGDRSK